MLIRLISLESLGGFVFTKKASKASVSTASRPVCASHLKWTQAHFNLKFSVVLMGEGKQVVSWGKTQPNVSGPSQAQAHHTTSSEKGTGQSLTVLPRQI